ncbi:CotH kinase family protein [Planococcus sp. APC 4015]|nr:CotH kinase family protein [Planococcus sp. APC 4015]
MPRTSRNPGALTASPKTLRSAAVALVAVIGLVLPVDAPAASAANRSAQTASTPATGLPTLSIQLPAGYDLSVLNASKDDVPRDPDVEPLSTASLADPTNPAHDFAGLAVEEIKGRGNFTFTLDKKPYQIEFEDATSVLGMAPAKTWILLANHADPSLMRNKLAFDLAAEFGLAATPDSRFVELVINGEHLGSFLVSEKVEVKANRLEMSDPGGIMLELDNSYGQAEDHRFLTRTSRSTFVLKDAVGGVDDVLSGPVAANYDSLRADIDLFESELYAPDPDWTVISSIIDVDSFLRYYFVAETASNPDVILSSVFFYRDGVDGLIHAGPVWDFDLAFGAYETVEGGADPRQDYVKNARFLRNAGNDWFAQLFRNDEFVAAANALYDSELRPIVDGMPAKIDGYAGLIGQSAAANFGRWNVLGQPAVFTDGGRVADTWQQEVASLREWISVRATHLAAKHRAGMPVLTYATHVKAVGWQPTRTSGHMAGTVGRGLQVEAIDLSLSGGAVAGGLEARAHVQASGWGAWQNQDATLGTTGLGRRVEAMQLRLTGDLAAAYDISYRVHVQGIGWMDWVENGLIAGTTGRGLQIEAVQLRLLEKSAEAPVEASVISYSAHVSAVGWMPGVQGGAEAGTTGRGLAMEALRADASSNLYTGGISYRAHVSSLGWMPPVGPGGYIGTEGRGLDLEAVEISLTGELAERYSVRYSAHVQGVGWMAPVTDGAVAGTTGQARHIEAIRIELVPKG